jgi:RNA polymerase sigma-70 factor (ECF subfamily)
MLQTALSETQAKSISHIAVLPSQISDNEIIRRIKEGDKDAYGNIMRRYNQRLFRIVRSFVTDDAAAMDIVQETHIKAYTKLDTFRGPTGFLTWLATIARNEALMYLRKHKRETVMSNDENLGFESIDTENKSSEFGISPDALVENHELKKLLNKNIDKLPIDFRTVFVLRAIEQCSVKSSAQILGIKEETVKTRYFRAKRLLREEIMLYLKDSGVNIYEFGGYHCDIIVHNVMKYLYKNGPLS